MTSTRPLPLIGSHVERASVLSGARDRGAAVVQVNLSAPQAWAPPKTKGDEQGIADSGIPVYVHAPYLLNPSSVNPVLRARSRGALIVQADAAAAVGARGLIVHAGHPTGSGTLDDAVRGWVEVLSGWTSPVPVLIENTAGGKDGPGRHVAGLAQLFAELRATTPSPLGFCLDTCHAWAGGLDLASDLEGVAEAVGRIDLLHCNDSRDPAGSGRDRHANLGQGQIPASLILQAVIAADAPVIVETPGGPAAQAADIAWLHAALS